MYISGRKRTRRGALRYLAASAFCGLFAAVYEHFGHGVYSSYMVYLFLWPLLGGMPALLLALAKPAAFYGRLYPARAVRELWGAGVATLTLGSCLRGVFDIYGTTAPLVRAYWFAGTLLLLTALALYIAGRFAAPAQKRTPRSMDAAQ